MNPSVALSDLIHSIESQNSKIVSQLTNEKSVIYTPSTVDEGMSYIEKSLNDLWYTSSCDGRNTQAYIAVVKCSSDAISLINQLNLLKDQYASLKKEISNNGFDFNKSLLDALDSPTLRKRLTSMGFSRLNINHLKRKVFVFEGDIKSIRYSRYSKGKTIKKITPEEAQRQLDDLIKKHPTSESLATQRSLLGNHPHSIPLVVVRPISPLIKVNINSTSKHKTFCTALPVFISNDDLSSDKISFFPTVSERKPRSDNSIEPKVFISSLNIFRKSQDMS